MKKLTKEVAVESGGKVWMKDGIERVYLNIEAVNTLTAKEGYCEISSVSKKMKQAKTFLDCKTGELKSDVGAIRSHLCGIGFKCEQ